MPSARDARTAARTASPAAPFGNPSTDEVFDILIPEGAATGKIPARDDYVGKIFALLKKEAKSSGNPMWVFTASITEGEYRGMDFDLFCPLTPNALWKLADTLAALGIKFSAGQPVSFKRSDIIGVGCRLVIKDDRNQDGTREVSRLAGLLPHPKGAGYKDGVSSFVPPARPDDDDKEADEEDAEPQPRARRSVRNDADDEEQGSIAASPRRRPAPVAEDEEEEVETPTRRGRKSATDEDDWEDPPASPSKSRRRPVEDDDEEEPEPPRKRAAAAPVGRRSRL